MNDNFYDKYNLAYKKLKSIFDLIYEEYDINNGVNSIEHIKYRLKKIDSIKDKLARRGFPDDESGISMLHDIVGVRIVCSFLSDLEDLKNIIRGLEKNNILEIVREKDYVTNPKVDSGYSSYHMQIRIPINYNNKIKYVNAEIQLRTIAMDMFASLEHKACYKKSGFSADLKNKIMEISSFSRQIDEELNSIVKDTRDNNKRESIVMYPVLEEREFKSLRLKYEMALKRVEDIFGELFNYYNGDGLVNPIEHMKSRIKSNRSIIRKLKCRGKDISIDNIESDINDFAGFRVVCSFLSDLEELKNIIRHDLDLEIIEEKDYVNNAKESGYRGYHFLVNVPVYTYSGVEYVMVEIQLRTIAMEMWASLEEKICYYREPNIDVVRELQRISSVINVIDNQIDIVFNHSRSLETRNVNTKSLMKVG